MSKLGIYDSGLGGYSIARAIRKQYPKQDLVFFSDQIHLPLGNKSKEQLFTYFKEACQWFKENDINEIIIACNTMSSVITKINGMKIHKIIEMTSLQVSDFNEVIVISTLSTYKSHSYRKAINRFNGKTKVHEIAFSNLASLIENCATRKEIINEIEANLKDYRNSSIPTILGCTHFPIIKDMISDYLKCETFDSIIPVLNSDCFSIGNGEFEVYTNGDNKLFDLKVEKIFNDKIKTRKVTFKKDE